MTTSRRPASGRHPPDIVSIFPFFSYMRTIQCTAFSLCSIPSFSLLLSPCWRRRFCHDRKLCSSQKWPRFFLIGGGGGCTKASIHSNHSQPSPTNQPYPVTLSALCWFAARISTCLFLFTQSTRRTSTPFTTKPTATSRKGGRKGKKLQSGLCAQPELENSLPFGRSELTNSARASALFYPCFTSPNALRGFSITGGGSHHWTPVLCSGGALSVLFLFE